MYKMIIDLLASLVMSRNTSNDLQSYFQSEYKNCAPAAYEYFLSTGNINYPG